MCTPSWLTRAVVLFRANSEKRLPPSAVILTQSELARIKVGESSLDLLVYSGNQRGGGGCWYDGRRGERGGGEPQTWFRRKRGEGGNAMPCVLGA